MTKKATRNKDFRTVLAHRIGAVNLRLMQKPKPLSELLKIPDTGLGKLRLRLGERATVLAAVQRGLPPKLSSQVITAGIEQGRLTIGVSGAVWASRLRYLTGDLRKAVGAELQVAILSVRVRVSR